MLFLTVLPAVLAFVLALPTGQDLRSLEDKNLLLDDIRFPTGFDIKSGIIGNRYRWPKKQLIYTIDPAFNGSEREIIEEAFKEISSKTCIRFRERTSERDYVYIQKGKINSGCWSYVGKIGGQQILNLQPPEYPGAGHCIWVGTAVHELIHAIGFHHEQSRYDRDDYVEIVWDNIPQKKVHNFIKMTEKEVDTFGVPYDYSSIMHYPDFAFAIDTSRPTIIAKQPGNPQFGNDRLSDYDVQKINRMYQC